ncbi:MAG: alanine racemase [Candidatus Eiseniibacteriota bacterium]
MPFSSWVEVDLDILDSNLDAIRRATDVDREILLVVKADAYGHGAVEVARAAAQRGVRQFGVATLHEGMQLRAAGVTEDVWVLSPLLASEIPQALVHGLEPTLPSLDFARELSQAALERGRPCRVHVEVDTGMGRTGIDATEAVDFLTAVDALPGVRVGSVYTHFPDADAEDLTFSRHQVLRFEEVLRALGERGLTPPFVHAANSAATLRLPEGRMQLVRPGLAAYGLEPPHAQGAADLKPAMSFRSRLVQVRRMRAGRPVSYGRTFVTARDSVIGVVPVGYGHGYSWLCSNRGAMLVTGRRVPIVGRVTMDLTMVDLTDLAQERLPRPGDPVVLFGRQNGASIPAEELAGWSETLPYEILCTIGKRVTRVYLRGGKPWRVITLVGEMDPRVAPPTDIEEVLDERSGISGR